MKVAPFVTVAWKMIGTITVLEVSALGTRLAYLQILRRDAYLIFQLAFSHSQNP
jgi:hypothetical protein